MKLLKVIDLVDKCSTKIKNISILFLLVLFFFTLIFGSCNKKRAERLFENVTGLKLENSILRKQIDLFGLEIKRRQKIQDSLLFAYQLKIEELNKLKIEYGKLRHDFNDLKSKVLDIPVEESYEFLNTVAYPYPGIKKFPFNEPQVKGIHLTWLENSNLKSQNLNLICQVKKSESMITDLNNINKQAEEKFNLALIDRDQYKSMAANSEKIRIYTEDELNRIRRQNQVLRWGVAGGVGAGFLLGLFLMK